MSWRQLPVFTHSLNVSAFAIVSFNAPDSFTSIESSFSGAATAVPPGDSLTAPRAVTPNVGETEGIPPVIPALSISMTTGPVAITALPYAAALFDDGRSYAHDAKIGGHVIHKVCIVK